MNALAAFLLLPAALLLDRLLGDAILWVISNEIHFYI